MDIFVSPNRTLHFQNKEYICAIGKGGIREDKIEGDGASPIGSYPIREIYYRSDRIEKPKCCFPISAITPSMGWCDASEDKNYNRLVTHPYPVSHEKLWREDHIYDVIVVLGYNDAPVVAGKGSAIFFHIARDNYQDTEGCIAVSLDHMYEILQALTPHTRFRIRSF